MGLGAVLYPFQALTIGGFIMFVNQTQGQTDLMYLLLLQVTYQNQLQQKQMFMKSKSVLYV